MHRAALLILFLTSFLVSCVTPYQTLPEGSCTGYGGGACRGVQTTDLGNDTYNIYVEVANTDRTLALEYFERRRGEIAEEKGYARCETLFVFAFNKDVGLLEGAWGAKADGRVKCFR